MKYLMLIPVVILTMPTIVDTHNSQDELKYYSNIEIISGSQPQNNIIQKEYIETEIHNIKLLKQEGKACMPTTLKMVLDSFGTNYTIEYLYRCVKYNPDIGTYDLNVTSCLDNLNIDYSYLTNIDISELKERDIVIYNATKTWHASAVDYTGDELILANPHAHYDTWNLTEFKDRFSGRAIRIEAVS